MRPELVVLLDLEMPLMRGVEDATEDGLPVVIPSGFGKGGYWPV